MKRKVSMLMVFALALMMTAVFSMPEQVSAASDAKKPKATNVQYYTDGQGKKTGIKTFTLDPYTYYNMSKNKDLNPGGESTMKLDDAALLRIAKKQIFPKWGVVAEGIFRDQANQLVTIEGSGLMSSYDSSKATDFDRHFSTGKVRNGYDYKWAVSDLAAELARENAPANGILKGQTCWDEVRATGVTKISNLNDARTLMGQELRNCSDDNDVSRDEFLGNNHQKNEDLRRLPDLEDDKSGDGYASVVTCVNRAGASGDYDYVTFGLAVYDFDITPVAAQNLKYIEAADNYEDGESILMGTAGDSISKAGITFQNDTTDGTTSYLRNNTTQEVTQSSGLENSATEESSLSTDDTFEWGMEQEIGTEWNFGGYSKGDFMFPRCTVNISNSWHELWSTTRSKSETKSTTKTKSVNTEVTLPGHTVAVINQSLNNKKTTENYQQPVILSYKVAVFAMSGDYFNGWGGGIENSRYDKQWMSVIFDGSDDYQTSGSYALGSLYNRAVVNKDTQGYDGAKGRYKVWCDKKSWNKSSKIDWNKVSQALEEDSRDSHRIVLGTGKVASTIKELATELPLMEKAQMLTSRRESITSSVDQIVAMYPLGSVSMKNGAKSYEVKPGEKLHLDTIEVEGFDEQNAEFYEFDPAWGDWQLLGDKDDDGNREVIEDGSSDDEDANEGKVKYGRITLVTDETTDDQWVEVDSSGEDNKTGYLAWKLKKGKNGAKITCNEYLTADDRDKPYMTDAEKDEVDTPTISVKVRDVTTEVVNIEAANSYETPVDEEINLAHVLRANAVDESGKVKNVAMFWEAKGDDTGIDVSENGDTRFVAKGTYKVRPYCYDSQNKKVIPKDENNKPVWLEVTAQDKATLSKIVIDKPDFDDDDVTLTKKKPAQSYALDSFIKYYDQYGEKWEGTKTKPLPRVEFTVNDTDGAEIDKESILTITKPGTYTISAKAYDVKKGADDKEVLEESGIVIKPIKITVSEDVWLDQIVLDEPALDRNELKLENSKDVVKVENLKGLLTYLDQNEDEWTGKKPNVTFSIAGEPKGAEIKGGNFYAYEPGTYTINASAAGFKINSIQIVVEEDQELVLETKDPAKRYLYHEGDVATVELDRCVNATTKFGGKWKGEVPDLVFSLDPGVSNAKITKKTVFEDEDDYEGTDVYEFSSSVPGEYVVHVKPKKASEYTEEIDDLYVTVVKGRKVAAIQFREINNDDPETGNMEEMAINHYTGSYPEIDLSDYLDYYDGYGEKIDPETDHVKIPDCRFELVEDEEEEPYNAKIEDGVLKPREPDYYMIKATMTLSSEEGQEDETAESMVNVMIYDMAWLHDFDAEWTTNLPPTCDYDGNRKKECKDKDCNAMILDAIPATGHRWKAAYEKLEPSEVPSGYDTEKYNYVAVKCEEEGCGAVNEDTITRYSKSYGEPLGYKEDHAATCTEPGILIFEDSNANKKEVNVPAIGHKWGKVFETAEGEDSTCSKEGREVIKCERCHAERKGEEYSRVIPKKKHALNDDGWEYYNDGTKVWKETCDDFGIKTQGCAECHEVQYKIIPELGHKWDAGKVTSEPTCMQDGVKTFTCERDKEHTKTEFMPAKGHDWGEWKVTRQPTAEEKGMMTRVCKNDPSHKETKEIDNSKQKKEAEAKSEATKKAAAAATSKITALPLKPGLADEAAVKAARKAYDSLTSEQKKLVSSETFSKLQAAEQAIRSADAKARKVKDVTANAATLSSAALRKAVSAAGGSGKYVTSMTIGKKVRKIAPNAFKSYKKVKTLTIKSKKLKKSSVRNALKGSRITKVKIRAGSQKTNQKYYEKYKKFFTKKNAGKKVKVII